MRFLTEKRSFGVFVATTVLIFAQVAWWTIVFADHVNEIAELRTQNAELLSQSGSIALKQKAKIEAQASRKRWMFYSEAGFFIILTLVGIVLIYRSLRAEQRSRIVQRNFLEMISHESKTPITALKLRLESLAEELEPSQREEVHRSLDEVKRLSTVFEKAMGMTQTEVNSHQFEVIPFSELVQDITRRLEPLFKTKQVKFQLKLDESARVRGDRLSLGNTVQSLLENSVLHNENTQKELDVCVRTLSSRVHLEVSDNGPGIPEEDRDHLFERFYRGKKGKKIPGTGLGLFLAKNIVEAHHGSIRYVPSSESRSGSLFRVELPGVSS